MSRAGREAPPAIEQPYAAACRDASWYNRPDVRTVKVFHIATVSDTAACNPGPEFQRSTPLDPNGYYRTPADVYDDLRCRRPGCRVHWDKIPAKPRQAGVDGYPAEPVSSVTGSLPVRSPGATLDPPFSL